MTDDSSHSTLHQRGLGDTAWPHNYYCLKKRIESVQLFTLHQRGLGDTAWPHKYYCLKKRIESVQLFMASLLSEEKNRISSYLAAIVNTAGVEFENQFV